MMRSRCQDIAYQFMLEAAVQVWILMLLGKQVCLILLITVIAREGKVR